MALTGSLIEAGTEEFFQFQIMFGPLQVRNGVLGLCNEIPAEFVEGGGAVPPSAANPSLPGCDPGGVIYTVPFGNTIYRVYTNIHHILSYSGGYSSLGTVHAAALPAVGELSSRLATAILGQQPRGADVAVLTMLDTGSGPATDGGPRWRPWLDAFGVMGAVAGDPDAVPAIPDSAHWAGGLAGGFDLPVTETLNLGLAIEGGRLSVAVPATGESAIGTYAQGGLYGLWHDGPWSAGIVALAGRLGLDTVTQTGTASYGIGFAALAGEIGYGFALDGVTVTPQAGLKLIGVFGDPFAETGSPLALAGQPSSYMVAQPSLGIDLRSTLALEGATLTPHASAKLVASLGDRAGTLIAALASGGQNFALTSGHTGSLGAELGAGLTLALDSGATLAADYRGTFTSGGLSHTANLTLKVPF